ncbi:thioredoxin family protein [Roseovarius aestuariivivens]|uniref:thioredoxin family protein n=1 Tax=Roseovarius aestuariivivens TaxID=1888910 RepID=UPI0010804CA4|nr:thioredoxin family protein [Roseovarius aestuariivivens]
MPHRRALLFSIFLAALAALPARALELVMVEQPGCHYCIEWKDTIGPIYPKTAEGNFAPLRMVQIKEMDETDIALTGGRVVFTPTFLLVENGKEIDRLEGYPGEDFFWPLLERMLTRNTDFTSPEVTN